MFRKPKWYFGKTLFEEHLVYCENGLAYSFSSSSFKSEIEFSIGELNRGIYQSTTCYKFPEFLEVNRRVPWISKEKYLKRFKRSF